MLFLKENWWNNLEIPRFLREFPLSTNPLISEQFFHDPLLIQISKTRYPPNIRGGGNYEVTSIPLQPSKDLWVSDDFREDRNWYIHSELLKIEVKFAKCLLQWLEYRTHNKGLVNAMDSSPIHAINLRIFKART